MTFSAVQRPPVRGMFSPPQKRIMGDSMMESRILPCDRDTNSYTCSPLTWKLKDRDDSAINTSFLESESAVSSCMFTSESYCGSTCCASYEAYPPNQSALTHQFRGDADQLRYNNFDDEASEESVDKSDIPSSSKLRPTRKKDVDWGDRSSIRLSIEYPKHTAVDIPSKLLHKANSANYFKICFDTEFSEEDEEIDANEDENTNNNDDDSSLPMIITTKPVNSLEHPSTCVKRKTPTMKIWFISSLTQRLIGEIETDDGFFSWKNLQPLNIAQIQLILNDLMTQICEKNSDLMKELSLRDELRSEKVNNRLQLDNFANHLYSQRVCNTPLCSPVFRPHSLSNAFDTNPTYRYPFNSPPTLPFNSRPPCPTSLPIPKQLLPVSSPSPSKDPSTPVSRFKSYLTRIFSTNRRQQATASFEQNDKKTHSF